MGIRLTHARRRNEDGSVVLIALLFAGLIAAVGLSLVTVATTERAVSDNYQKGAEVLYATEALAEVAIAELANRSSWSSSLTGAEPSSFFDPSLIVPPSWNDPPGAWGANTPVWRPFASGTFASLTGQPDSASINLVAWIADDAADGDDDPNTDSNGVVTLRAQAIDRAGSRRTVQVALKREADDSSVSDPSSDTRPEFVGLAASVVARNLPYIAGGAPAQGAVRLLSWREVR